MVVTYCSGTSRPNPRKSRASGTVQPLSYCTAASTVWLPSCFSPILQDPSSSKPTINVDCIYIKVRLTRIYLASGYAEYSSAPYIAAG